MKFQAHSLVAKPLLLAVAGWALRRWVPTPNPELNFMQKSSTVAHPTTWLSFLAFNWKKFEQPQKMVMTAIAWTAVGALLSTALLQRKQRNRIISFRNSPGSVLPIVLWGLFATAESAYLASLTRPSSSLGTKPKRAGLLRA